MHFISILFFSISSSSDNFIIGLSYGTKKIKINFLSNLVIALISCIGTFASMLLGSTLHRFLSPHRANEIGSIVLILFGLYMLINSFRKRSDAKSTAEVETYNIRHYNDVIEHPEIIDADHSKTIDFREAAVLGLVLCLNNIGLGIGASITGLNIYMTSLSSLFFSIIFIKAGCYIGSKTLSDQLSNYSEAISSVIIILLGIYEFFI